VADPETGNSGRKGRGWGLGYATSPKIFFENLMQYNAFWCKTFICFRCIRSTGRAAAPRPPWIRHRM